ncbi:protein phosphatase [Epibacterium sp. MM17-32]|uniref:protein-tyrosine phosphatase family protein n=1 Tax=Epibacterium sp. MM17-32 TaxID=2917734 RepID=UPI001EF55780|nr:protein-tyrosine phosphatase family protein [Epibacterium sp. MM17-32]MCG7628720.1 protein phosphatase [Epibacterium sp. MM17-32]
MVSVSDLQPQEAAQTLSLHALSIGEGILALSQAPGAGGDYPGDLRLIREWRASIVVTLTTRVEQVILGTETLGCDIQGLGSRWFHLPIEDYQTPTTDQQERWTDISGLCRQALSGGGRVLVHCRGGCGRSGMVALRLMIESGERPDAALHRLRLVRPCAIETDAQIAWAYGPRRTAPPASG